MESAWKHMHSTTRHVDARVARFLQEPRHVQDAVLRLLERDQHLLAPGNRAAAAAAFVAGIVGVGSIIAVVIGAAFAVLFDHSATATAAEIPSYTEAISLLTSWLAWVVGVPLAVMAGMWVVSGGRDRRRATAAVWSTAYSQARATRSTDREAVALRDWLTTPGSAAVD